MRSIIDPVSRIEGHLRVEMEVNDGVVTDAWVTGGLFRGMELVLQGREPRDAAYIAQRICGVCPVSHAHASCFASEAAMGITLSNGARVTRNLIEGAQFLHSNILWFYNLTGLDYVDPVNALNANVADTYSLAEQAGTSTADFAQIQERLRGFVNNGQLSIFSGNWFTREGYSLPAELDLIGTAHYLEALQYQAIASEISAIMAGKMPHIMGSVPGGTTFLPSFDKIDGVRSRILKIRDWVANTMLPDVLAIAPFYSRAFGYGHGVGRYVAWGVFNDPTQLPQYRYLPAGVVDEQLRLTLPDETLIKEYTGHSFYADASNLNPAEGVTDPLYPAGGADLNPGGRYTWSKAPTYAGKPYEAGPLSRMLAAYLAGVPRVRELVDGALAALGAPGRIDLLQSTLGRVAARCLETVYTSELMVGWIDEYIAEATSGTASYFTEPATTTGEGFGMWEAPRGALLHYAKLTDGTIDKYQIIIPTTWNIAPRNEENVMGPMEQALVGVPVADPQEPIDALRTIHSFDPCVACAVHVTEPKTGKEFETVINPWGVK